MKPANDHSSEILIVGQGIAGTLLAFFLWQKNWPFRVVDRPLPGASSLVAAGIVNPVTGMRFVKSWRFDQLAAHAFQTYRALGDLLGRPVFQTKNILWALPDVFSENEWDRRSAFPENTAFFCEKPDPGAYLPFLRPFHSMGELTGAAQVDMAATVVGFREFLRQNGLLTEAVFDFGEMKPGTGSATYRGYIFRKIIFCEGAKAVENPYFSDLPFSPTKGELLLVRVKGLHSEKMLKNKLYLVPLGNELFWAGATNDFQFSSPEPTPEKRDFLEKSLAETLRSPVEIVAHQAGIRPTVADRRPFLGFHREFPSLGIFNGLGTKGASVGPYFASLMADCLAGKGGIEAEVNIGRFELGH